MATVTPDVSRGPVLLSLSSMTASLAFSTTIVRFCLRTRSDSRIGPDDYSVAVASVVGLIGTIFSIVEGSMKTSSGALEFDVLGQPWLMMGATLSKISICLFFIRVLGARRWRMLLGTMIVLMAVVNLTFSMTVNLQCRPLEKLWNPQTDGACWDPSVQLNFGYFQGAFSVFSWFFLSLFPIMILRELDMQRHPRWPFYVLSALSFAVGILATARTFETSQVGGLSIYTSATSCAEILAVFEQNIGIVAANVLPMGAFFSRSSFRKEITLRVKTPSRAESSRTITRVSSSRASSSRRGAGEMSSVRSSLAADPKRSPTTLIIEGPRRISYDTSREGGAVVREYELEARSIRDSYGADAWPRGIIKTVSVEVVEEDNPDLQGVKKASAGGEASRNSDISMEQDWETMLRGGPAPGRA
ncbi:hypothetical protein CONLIGDRAFT_415583 [Coniochaeta ligniaria NRRL 30616]|uniref:Rhodopsin domain-containing protein n=1 Tax=Coniochaeta ligniaria NRRL 30616 TaxID=1408157 RepID=A0A1J7JD43_9PEZI|nr:hypothetical protein CONLIGDRAFT_415583 [Coniochaeta ligniaria NRRL 30616]